MSNQSLQRRIQELGIDDDFSFNHQTDEPNENTTQTQNEADGEDSMQVDSQAHQSQANAVQNGADGNQLAQDMYDIPEEERLAEASNERFLQELEGNGAHSDRRLLAPPNEVQRRNRVSKKDQIDELRAKQMKLVDLQIDLNKILVDTAKLVQEREEILLAQARASNSNE